jgi:hypothetical protein
MVGRKSPSVVFSQPSSLNLTQLSKTRIRSKFQSNWQASVSE